MLVVYRSFILVACVLLTIVMTIQLLTTVNINVKKMKRGSEQDTGIFPKRSRNINAWYSVNVEPGSVGATGYPQFFPGPTGAYKPGQPARIGLAKTTACPIFRRPDDGSTGPPLIG